VNTPITAMPTWLRRRLVSALLVASLVALQIPLGDAAQMQQPRLMDHQRVNAWTTEDVKLHRVLHRPIHRPDAGSLPLSMTFEAFAGGPNPLSQTLNITNTGTGGMKWEVASSAPWLTLSPTSGRTRKEPDVVTVSVSTTGLSAGSYSAIITLRAQDLETRWAEQQVAVSLHIKSPAPTISLSNSSLAFASIYGSTPPGSQVVSIRNTGGGTMNWTTSSSAPWLTVAPPSGDTTTETDSLNVAVNTTGMGIGTYQAPIKIDAPGATNSPQEVMVTLAITAATSNVTLMWDALTTNADGTPLTDLAGYKVYLGTAPRTYTSSVDAGLATSMVLTNLAQGTTYYLAVTAYDTGKLESGYSNEVSKAFP